MNSRRRARSPKKTTMPPASMVRATITRRRPHHLRSALVTVPPLDPVAALTPRDINLTEHGVDAAQWAWNEYGGPFRRAFGGEK